MMELLQEVKRLRQIGEVPTDATLVCEGGDRVETYHILCAAVSPVLRAALEPSRFKEGDTRTVVLDWARASLLERMFAFACGDGGGTLSGDDAMALLPLADRLDYRSMRTVCETTLSALLTSDNAADIQACARACGCPTLAAKAQAVANDPEFVPVVRSLMDSKRELEGAHDDLLRRIAELQREARAIKDKVKDVAGRITFESEKAFLEAEEARSCAAATSGESPPESGEGYPHAALRTLKVAASTPQKKRSKDSKATAGLVFEDLSAALAASKPGDIIELPPGTHEISEDEDVIKYSLQIVGMGDGVVLAWEAETMITVKAADVRIANLKIDGARVSSEGLVRVEDGGRVWLDECNIAIKDGRVSVHKDSSATLTRCTLRGGQGSAIEIDPQAKAVLVKDCSITGSGAGDDGPEPAHNPNKSSKFSILPTPYS